MLVPYRIISRVASVVRIGGRGEDLRVFLNLERKLSGIGKGNLSVIKPPLISPAAPPVPIPAIIPTTGEAPLLNAMAVTHADIAKIAPMERSRPPDIITSASPQASKPMNEALCPTANAFPQSREFGAKISKPSANNTVKSIVGASRGSFDSRYDFLLGVEFKMNYPERKET